MNSLGLAQPAVSLSEAQAFVRAETGEEEALLAGLIRTASSLCESFLNQVVMARPFREELKIGGAWERLQLTPVRSIDTVEAVANDGTLTPLAVGTYSIDIDSTGDGWVRLLDANATQPIRVSGTAGMATQANDIPEPIRQGVLRLTAHLYTARDGNNAGPPAAVTALWRPYRRARLA